MAPADGQLTEEIFRKTALDFVGVSALRWDGNNTGQLEFDPVARGWQTATGTVPAGSTWRKVPIPTGIWGREGPTFEPVCRESEDCLHAARGLGRDLNQKRGACKCSGFSNPPLLMPNLEVVDKVRIPQHVKPGKYVVQWRWDCEESDQVWASCSDITVI